MTFSFAAVHKNVWFIIITAIAFLTIGLFALNHVNPVKRDLVATAFLMDLVISFPVVYYFLLIRPLKLRKWSIVLVFSICCGVAYIILPAHQRSYILQLRKITVGLELGIVIYALTKIRQVNRVYRELQTTIPDFAYNFQQSMTTVLGKHPAVKFLTTELTLIRFGLLCWLRPKSLSAATKKFSIHRESGYGSLFGIILFVGAIELVAFHLFLNHYSHLAALIVSSLSAYSFIFIIGDFSAIVKSPVLIIADQLLLRTGIRWRALIELDNIESVKKVKDNVESGGDCFRGALMKSSANILFTFKEPVIIHRIYRKPITTKQLLMAIDGVDGFIKLTGDQAD
jgi:hypothetical protein